MSKKIRIIGGGLAGSEAALQLARRGWIVELFEMRPNTTTPAHETELLGELVCSNSLKSTLISTASGLLKEELKYLGVELLAIAEKVQVPAGNALAVDRIEFAKRVTERLEQTENVRINRREVTELDDSLTILATGPLTSPSLMDQLNEVLGAENLYFFDAIAPIISSESINREIVYQKSRYDKGTADYLNAPFSKEEYLRFVDALNQGNKYIGKDFEKDEFTDLHSRKLNFYENCIPIEELAKRGTDTLRFGVLKPVGLEDPRTGRRPYAALQLRCENKDATAYNLVGCQTMLTQASQREVFRLIPGLEDADFYRYGSIHRNSYLNSPSVLNSDLSLRVMPNLYIAGQLSGVEGYVESIASGLLISLILAEELQELPDTTILGQLWRKLTMKTDRDFTPQNANFGLLPSLEVGVRDKSLKKKMLSERALSDLRSKVNTLVFK